MYIFNGDTSANINPNPTDGWVQVVRRKATVGVQVNLPATGSPIGLFVFEVSNDDDPRTTQGVKIGATPLILSAPQSTTFQPTDGLARNVSFMFNPGPTAKWMRMRYARTSGGGVGLNAVWTQYGMGSSAPPFVPYTAPSTGGPPNASALSIWYDAQDVNFGAAQPTNLAAIATWKNKGTVGTNGDLLQATGGLQPQFVSVASAGKLNNLSCVRSSGTKWMQSSAITTLNQPTLIAMVCMTTTIGAGIFDVLDGRTSARNIMLRVAAVNEINAGSFVATTGNFVANTYHGINAVFNGAASVGRFDGSASGAVNPGAGGLDGVTVFADLAGGSLWTGDIIEVLIYNGAGQPTAAQVESYFTTRYGATPQ